MEKVSDLYPHGVGYKTRVWITAQGRKDWSKIPVPVDLAALFENRAERGFQGYIGKALRKEGDEIWAYGTDTWTVRIAGFFYNHTTRTNFIIGGVWSGKSGGKKKGNKRPPEGDTVVARIEQLKVEGVVWD